MVNIYEVRKLQQKIMKFKERKLNKNLLKIQVGIPASEIGHSLFRKCMLCMARQAGRLFTSKISGAQRVIQCIFSLKDGILLEVS